MKSNDFIIKKINKLVLSFPNIKCSYEFDSFDEIHVIKIEPKALFENTKNYLFKNGGVLDEFTERFPYEGLALITNNDIIDIENSLYVKKGDLFDVSVIKNYLFDSFKYKTLSTGNLNYEVLLEKINLNWGIEDFVMKLDPNETENLRNFTTKTFNKYKLEFSSNESSSPEKEPALAA